MSENARTGVFSFVGVGKDLEEEHVRNAWLQWKNLQLAGQMGE